MLPPSVVLVLRAVAGSILHTNLLPIAPMTINYGTFKNNGVDEISSALFDILMTKTRTTVLRGCQNGK